MTREKRWGVADGARRTGTSGAQSAKADFVPFQPRVSSLESLTGAAPFASLSPASAAGAYFAQPAHAAMPNAIPRATPG